MKLTEVQKSITKAINSRSVTNILSFLDEFCELEIKDTIGILDNVDFYYLSLNPQKNHLLCQEFMILLNKLYKHSLIALSPDESEKRFLVFTSEDGPQPAVVDTKLMKIISSHLDSYAEDINSISQGFSVSKEIIPLPELEDFIANDFSIEPDPEKKSSQLRSTGVNKIDEVRGFFNELKRAPGWTGVALLCLILVLGFTAYVNGFFGERGKQAANTNAAGRAHLSAVRPAINLRMSDDVFDLNTSFSFKNAGNSGATKIQGFAKLILSDESFKPTAHSHVHVLDSIGIRQTKSIRLRNNETPFPRQSWAVEHDSLYIYLFGKIDYQDVFDKWHWTEFTFKYNYSRGEFEVCCDYNGN